MSWEQGRCVNFGSVILRSGKRVAKDDERRRGRLPIEARCARTSGMTEMGLDVPQFSDSPKPLREHLFQNPPLDVLVGHRSIVPPPAVALHLLGGRDNAVGHFSEIRAGVVQAADQTAGSNP